MSKLILLALVIFMAGCSGISIEYPQDRIDRLPPPEKTIVIWRNSKREIGDTRTSGETTYYPGLDIYVMDVPRNNACAYEHEHKHASGDMTHDGWSAYLMNCGNNRKQKRSRLL